MRVDSSLCLASCVPLRLVAGRGACRHGRCECGPGYSGELCEAVSKVQVPPEVCALVAPRGGWLFAMPQHTGTHTVVDFLNRQNQTLGMWRCLHHHDVIRGTLPVPNTVFTLLFVANPYRRVLAHAAHCGVVPSAATSSAPSSREQIRQFSKFVSRLTMWNVSQRAACYHRCYAYDLRRHGFMWNQYRFLTEQPTEHLLVGRTAQLSEHLMQALAVLGYRHVEGALK